MDKKIEAAAISSQLAEMYDRYESYCIKNADDDIIDYDTMVESFAKSIIDECVKVCESERDPLTLNYKPSQRIAEAIRRHFKL